MRRRRREGIMSAPSSIDAAALAHWRVVSRIDISRGRARINGVGALSIWRCRAFNESSPSKPKCRERPFSRRLIGGARAAHQRRRRAVLRPVIMATAMKSASDAEITLCRPKARGLTLAFARRASAPPRGASRIIFCHANHRPHGMLVSTSPARRR